MKQDKVIFTPRYAVNLFIVYELDTRKNNLNINFTPGNCLFVAVKLNKNSDPNKYGYNGYGIVFASRLDFLINDEFAKDVIIFGVHSSSAHTNNREKKILVLGESPAQ